MLFVKRRGMLLTPALAITLGLGLVMALAATSKLKQEHAARVGVLGLYWHFVDAVWIAVFTVVYVIGR